MTKDRTPAKGITLKNGNRLNYGQLFPSKDETMSDDSSQQHAMRRIMERRSAPKDAFGNALGRDGAPKRLTDPAPVHGQTRREDKGGHSLAFVGAKRPLDDEPLQKSGDGKGNVPTHPGMVTRSVSGDVLRGTHDPKLGDAVLQEASRLGRAPEE
jgi:hypothetical protein